MHGTVTHNTMSALYEIRGKMRLLLSHAQVEERILDQSDFEKVIRAVVPHWKIESIRWRGRGYTCTSKIVGPHNVRHTVIVSKRIGR